MWSNVECVDKNASNELRQLVSWLTALLATRVIVAAGRSNSSIPTIIIASYGARLRVLETCIRNVY